jgi:hypothetical protein
MRSWLKASAFGCLIHILGYPLILFLAFGSAMSAFSPTHKPSKMFWAKDGGFLPFVWAAGFKVSSKLADYIIFGKPKTPVASDSPNLNEKQPHYYQYRKYDFVTIICWIFNTLFFGMMVGSIYYLIRFIPSRRW